jgi:hypothetical protein
MIAAVIKILSDIIKQETAKALLVFVLIDEMSDVTDISQLSTCLCHVYESGQM